MFFHWRISLAEAHCKLCLRTRVREEDAVIAVLLCENSVTLKHGSLFLSGSHSYWQVQMQYLHNASLCKFTDTSPILLIYKFSAILCYIVVLFISSV